MSRAATNRKAERSVNGRLQDGGKKLSKSTQTIQNTAKERDAQQGKPKPKGSEKAGQAKLNPGKKTAEKATQVKKRTSKEIYSRLHRGQAASTIPTRSRKTSDASKNAPKDNKNAPKLAAKGKKETKIYGFRVRKLEDGDASTKKLKPPPRPLKKSVSFQMNKPDQGKSKPTRRNSATDMNHTPPANKPFVVLAMIENGISPLEKDRSRLKDTPEYRNQARRRKNARQSAESQYNYESDFESEDDEGYDGGRGYRESRSESESEREERYKPPKSLVRPNKQTALQDNRRSSYDEGYPPRRSISRHDSYYDEDYPPRRSNSRHDSYYDEDYSRRSNSRHDSYYDDYSKGGAKIAQNSQKYDNSKGGKSQRSNSDDYSREVEERSAERLRKMTLSRLSQDEAFWMGDTHNNDSAYGSEGEVARRQQHNRHPPQRQAAGHDSGRLQRTLLTEREKQKGIFTVKDQHSQSPTSIKQVDYDQDKSGVYRARSQDPLIADEIRDSRETVVELPFDDRPAEEIRAEEIQTQPIRRRYDLQANVEDSCSGVMPSSEPSVEVELDDSGNIVSLTSVTSNPCLPVCVASGLPTTGSVTWRSAGSLAPAQKGEQVDLSQMSTGMPLKTNQLNTEKRYSSWSSDIRDLKKRLLSNLSAAEEVRVSDHSEGTKLHASPDFFLSQAGGPLAVEEFYRHSQTSRHQSVPKYMLKSPRHDTVEPLTVQSLGPVRSASATRNDGWKTETARVDSVRPRGLPNVVESVCTFETARDDFLLDTARGGHTHDELPLVFITARERASCQKLLLSPDEQSCGDKLLPEESIALSSPSMCISPNSEGSDMTDLRGDYVRHPSPATSEEMKLYNNRFEELTVRENGHYTSRRKTPVDIIIPKLGKPSNLRNDTTQSNLGTPRPSARSYSYRTQDKESRSNDASPNSPSTPRTSIKNFSCRTRSETELRSNVSTPSSLNTPRTSVKNQSFRTQPEMDMLLSKGNVNTDFSASDCSDSWTYSPMALCKPYNAILSPVKPGRTVNSDHVTRLLNGELDSSPSFVPSTRSNLTDVSRSVRNNCNAGSPQRGSETPQSNAASPTKCNGGTLKVKVDLKSRRYSVFKVPAPQIPLQSDGLGIEVNTQVVDRNPSDSVNRNQDCQEIVSS